MGELTQESTRRSAKAGEITLNYFEAGPVVEEAQAAPVVEEAEGRGRLETTAVGAETAPVVEEAEGRGRLETTAVGGGLPLVMLHGGGPGASAWSNFGACLPRFAASFRTLLVDQPGFGESDKPPVVGNYYRFAADHVVKLLDELGIDRVHLLGNSLGGGTAMRLALSHPDRVGRLVLMGPGGLSLNLFHADPTQGVQRLMDFASNPTREAMRAFISTMVVNQDLVTDELVEERFAAANAPGAREAMASMGMSFWNPDTAEDGLLWREAHRLRKHTLLTWGREDRVNPLDGAFTALKLIPKASLHVFPNCGHWAQVEAAEEFAEISTAFLARHVERPRG